MARSKGTANLAASIEPLAGAPLDARNVCPTVEDLYISANWPYRYIGMKTTVTATGDTYRLVNMDVTQASSWVKEGATEYDDFTGATSQEAGIHGLVPAPAITDMEKFLKGDGTWGVVPMPSFDYSNTSPDAMNFSTDEKVIGTWSDGKPLYQKVIETTLPTVTTTGTRVSKQVSVGASIDIGFITCAFYKSINNNYNPIMFLSSDKANVVNAVLYPNNGIVYQNLLNINNDSATYSEAPAYFIVRYTKTTDSPVASGEKIVGQWIDGRPLYEKTVECGTLPNNTSKTVAHNISNIAKIVYINGYGLNGTSHNTMPLPYITGDGGYEIGIWANATNVGIRSNYNATIVTESYITLRYTKAS